MNLASVELLMTLLNGRYLINSGTTSMNFIMYGVRLSLPNLKTKRPRKRSAWCIQLFRERLLEKSAKVHATIPKGTVGIFREF